MECEVEVGKKDGRREAAPLGRHVAFKSWLFGWFLGAPDAEATILSKPGFLLT